MKHFSSSAFTFQERCDIIKEGRPTSELTITTTCKTAPIATARSNVSIDFFGWVTYASVAIDFFRYDADGTFDFIRWVSYSIAVFDDFVKASLLLLHGVMQGKMSRSRSHGSNMAAKMADRTKMADGRLRLQSWIPSNKFDDITRGVQALGIFRSAFAGSSYTARVQDLAKLNWTRVYILLLEHPANVYRKGKGYVIINNIDVPTRRVAERTMVVQRTTFPCNTSPNATVADVANGNRVLPFPSHRPPCRCSIITIVIIFQFIKLLQIKYVSGLHASRSPAAECVSKPNGGKYSDEEAYLRCREIVVGHDGVKTNWLAGSQLTHRCRYFRQTRVSSITVQTVSATLQHRESRCRRNRSSLSYLPRSRRHSPLIWRSTSAHDSHLRHDTSATAAVSNSETRIEAVHVKAKASGYIERQTSEPAVVDCMSFGDRRMARREALARKVTSGRKICDCKHQRSGQYDCRLGHWTECMTATAVNTIARSEFNDVEIGMFTDTAILSGKLQHGNIRQQSGAKTIIDWSEGMGVDEIKWALESSKLNPSEHLCIELEHQLKESKTKPSTRRQRSSPKRSCAVMAAKDEPASHHPDPGYHITQETPVIDDPVVEVFSTQLPGRPVRDGLLPREDAAPVVLTGATWTPCRLRAADAAGANRILTLASLSRSGRTGYAGRCARDQSMSGACALVATSARTAGKYNTLPLRDKVVPLHEKAHMTRWYVIVVTTHRLIPLAGEPITLKRGSRSLQNPNTKASSINIIKNFCRSLNRSLWKHEMACTFPRRNDYGLSSVGNIKATGLRRPTDDSRRHERSYNTSLFSDKRDVKQMYTEIDFAIGSQFSRHALDGSEPIADFQGNKKRYYTNASYRTATVATGRRYVGPLFQAAGQFASSLTFSDHRTSVDQLNTTPRSEIREALNTLFRDDGNAEKNMYQENEYIVEEVVGGGGGPRENPPANSNLHYTSHNYLSNNSYITSRTTAASSSNRTRRRSGNILVSHFERSAFGSRPGFLWFLLNYSRRVLGMLLTTGHGPSILDPDYSNGYLHLTQPRCRRHGP
ncbi:hypothetical protein PR048_015074 [Dryococelus australis]|uniref:Uncharacterized protein n=1 Tax=Dryococelus australis TaxID=614101 RepID=A0ABQ9HG37_9NEOP|nr:hypothetical protein PR048_015074 [Dryococelus australis]